MKIERYWIDTNSGNKLNPLNFNKMKTTQTTTGQKPSLFLKAFAVLIAIKGLVFLAAAIYTAFTNLL